MKQNSGLLPIAVIFLISVIITLNLILPALAFRWKMVVIIAFIGIGGALVMMYMKRKGGDGGK